MADPELIFLIAAGLLCGMFAAGAGLGLLYMILMTAALLGALSLYSRRFLRPVVWAGIAGAVLAGAFYFHLHAVVTAAGERLPPPGESAVFQALVTDVRPYGSALALGVRLEPPYQGKARVIVPSDTDAHYGDVREFQGRFVRPDDSANVPTAIRATSRLLRSREGSPLKQRLIDIRDHVLQGFAVLPAEEAGLLGGLTLGAKAAFTDRLREDFAKSGTTHLVALSGYNIGILILILSGMFSSFLPRRATFLITLVSIALFVTMTGAEASIVRAAIMGALVLIAREAGRMYSVRHAIVYAGLLMALGDPGVLTADLGFQLSFASFLGIAYLAPALRTAFHSPEDGGALNWRENLFTALGAQAAVLPLILGRFGAFPLASLPANLVLLPLVPFTMALGGLMALAGTISGYLALLIAWVAHILLSVELAVIHLAAAFPVQFRMELRDPLLIAGYYAILALFVLSTRAPRKQP